MRHNRSLPKKSKLIEWSIEYFIERSIPEPNSGCWIWLGAMQWNGYGAVNIGGKVKRAHRAAFELANQCLVPRKTDVCHRCDNRACVNPGHLFTGTRTDNMRDCSAKGRIRIPGLKGEDAPAAKLTEDQVREIRVDDRSNRALAKIYAVDRRTISLARRGLTWRHI